MTASASSGRPTSRLNTSADMRPRRRPSTRVSHAQYLRRYAVYAASTWARYSASVSYFVASRIPQSAISPERVRTVNAPRLKPSR